MRWCGNKAFQRLIANATRPKSLSVELQGILTAGIFEDGGCLLFRRERAADFQSDRTGRECLHNHVHVKDFAEAVLFAERLFGFLIAKQHSCCVILSFHLEDAEGTVRFHKRRPEESSYLSENLEAYVQEAVGFLE